MRRTITYLLLFSLGLLLPVSFAVYFSNNSKNITGDLFYQRAALHVEHTPDLHKSQFQADEQEAKSDFLTINSDSNLDPSADNFFIVSSYIKIDELPKQGRRQKIIGKYLDQAPYSGWALGIKRLSTSVRPEVYFQGIGKEPSAWYTFEKVKFKKKHWYAITVVFKKSEAVNLFLEEISNPSELKLGTEKNNEELIAVAEAKEQEFQEPLFLGGYNFLDIGFKSTSANMDFAPTIMENGEFKGEISDLLIINTKELNFSKNALIKIIKGGPQKLASNFNSENIVFWASKEGDKSKYQRQVLRKF